MAKVVMTSGSAEQMEDLTPTIHARVERILARLENWPSVSGAKPLRGGLAGRFRVRTGDYRVQFRVDGDRLIVEKIGHRDGFYED